MSHTSPTETDPENHSEKPVPVKRRWQPARSFVTPAIAVIALAVAIAGWFHTGKSASPSYSEQQTAQAKTDMCSAFTAVRQAVITNTHLDNPNGNDPVGQLAVAANARLALLGGGTYLQERLTAQPAMPTDLANAVKSLSDKIQQLAINYLAGASDLLQDPLRHDVDSQINQINDMCK